MEIPIPAQEKELFALKMGPQHPATHGVLRLDLFLDGETIAICKPDVGYLHRGFEKIAENKSYAQFLPITDRLDYIGAMANNVGYCHAVETLLNIEVPERANYIRTIVAEMSRISGHLLWLATHALDIGAMTVFLYCFREREILLDLFEELCGARLTTSYTRLGGVRQDVSALFMDNLTKFTDDFPTKIADYETLIDTNRIWLKRTQNIGVISGKQAVQLGFTGPTLRGSGVDYDVRKHRPYCVYDRLDFQVPLGRKGDIYDRYLCRMEEFRQSVAIIKQCLEQLPPGPIVNDDAPDLIMPITPQRKVAADSIGSSGIIQLMEDRNIYMEGDVYVSTEAPKGELGFYFVSDGEGRPYRMHIRSPSFIHIGGIPAICEGEMVADVIACIGSLDVVLGECDR
ncbi:MAG: NADH-quinone oxidoreductase subunit D [Desulfobulbaceae bacterium]|nr:MAG: NADH-quinone oxidoreductase subunit D [Desulfobulbaceae bacterium]